MLRNLMRRALIPHGRSAIMYLEYWRLKNLPFQEVLDPRFLYLSRELDEAVTRIRYAVTRHKGVALLTGDPGTGTTTSLNILADILSAEKANVALVSQPDLDPTAFLREAAHRFGLSRKTSPSKADLLNQLHAMLRQNAKENQDTVLFIDEAQDLPKKTLEEIRLLLNDYANGSFRMTAVLAGQPVLRDKVREINGFDEIVDIRYHLKPMDFEDTSNYITNRLKAAGAARRIFTFEAMVEIYDYSLGIPLVINRVCDRCLDLGSSAEKTVIGAEIVKDAIQTSRLKNT